MEALFFCCLSLCCCRGRGLDACGSAGLEEFCWPGAGPEVLGTGVVTAWGSEDDWVDWGSRAEVVEVGVALSCKKASIMEEEVEAGWYGCRLVKGLCTGSVWGFISADTEKKKIRLHRKGWTIIEAIQTMMALLPYCPSVVGLVSQVEGPALDGPLCECWAASWAKAWAVLNCSRNWEPVVEPPVVPFGSPTSPKPLLSMLTWGHQTIVLNFAVSV